MPGNILSHKISTVNSCDESLESVNLDILKKSSIGQGHGSTRSKFEFSKQLVLLLKKQKKFPIGTNIPENDPLPKLQATKNQQIYSQLCDCLHFNDIIIDEEINASPEKVFDTIYHDSSEFLQEIAKRKNMQNLRVSDKIQESDGTFYRYIFHDYPNAFLGKTAKNTSKINFCIMDREKKHFSVTYINETDGIPLAKSFIVHVRLCLSLTDNGNTHMKISWHIEFVQNIWDMSKTIISKRSMAISQDIMLEYVTLLRHIYKTPLSNDLDQNSSRKSAIIQNGRDVRTVVNTNWNVSSLSCFDDAKLLFSPPFLATLIISIILVLLGIIIHQQMQIQQVLKMITRNQS